MVVFSVFLFVLDFISYERLVGRKGGESFVDGGKIRVDFWSRYGYFDGVCIVR